MRDYEQEARKGGWVPQEEWKGEDDAWKPAQQFVEDGEKTLPIFKARVEKELGELKDELKQAKRANTEAGDFFRNYKERQEKETADLRDKLVEKRQQAVDDSDGQAFTAADKELRELDAQPTQTFPPETKQWLTDNPWYETNEKLSIYADGVADRLVQQGYVGGSKAYWDELTTRVKDAHPDEFENKQRSRPASVEDTSETIDSKPKTAANLPADAKKAGNEFVEQGLFKDLEEYAAAYDWETE